jgi:hypothetical protein
METHHLLQLLKAIADLAKRLLRIEQKLNDEQFVKHDWLDHTDVCKMLHISKRTLDSYREKGLLPGSKLGGKVFYRYTDIDGYLRTHLSWKEGRI